MIELRRACLLIVFILPRFVLSQCATPTDTIVTSVLNCQPYTWAQNGITYTESTSTSTLSSDGCTLYILNLTLYENQVDVRRIFACDSYFWSVTGQSYTSSGTYTHQEITEQGCTIDHQLVLTISNTFNNSEAAVNCDTYTWQEMEFSSGGMVGKAVDLDASGTVLAVGDETAGTSGEVRVYYWSEAGWLQMGSTLVAEFNPERFGASVSLSANGKFLAVGSPSRNPVGGFASYGQVKVFEWSGTDWLQRGSVISGIDDFDELGFSVDLSNDGNVLAAGAPSSGRVALELGEVRVYQWTGGDWKQMGNHIYKHEFLNSANNNGYSVSLSGDGTKLIFGAPFSHGILKNTPGKYFVFEWDGSKWNLASGVQGASNQERLGWCVAISNDGTKKAIGSPAYNSNAGKISSSFESIIGDVGGASFGKSLAINSNAQILAVGSPLYSTTNSNVGKVKVYRYSGASYQPLGGDIIGVTANEQLGTTIALNHSGNIMAVNGRVYYYGCTNSAQNCTTSNCTSPLQSTLDTTACYSYKLDGINYTESGKYEASFISKQGCDSLVTLNLTVVPTVFTYDITVCNSFDFKDNTLTASGTYSDWWPANTTRSGCDSSVVINLTVGAGHDTYQQNVNTCTSYVFNGTTLTESGTYEALFPRPSGCDSLVRLNLNVTRMEVSETINTCGSYNFDGNVLTESGVYNGLFTTVSGCDSLVTLNLTVNKSFDIIQDVEACASYTFDGNELTASGVYYGTYTTKAGCDSLVTLNLTISDSFSTSQSVTTCDKYIFGGEELTTSGIYEHLFITENGCDSLVSLNLIVNKSENVTLNNTTCEPIDFYGQTLTESGVYEKLLTTAAGCDSLIVMNLTFLSSSDIQCAETVTAIEPDKTSGRLKLYPNPAKENLSIELGMEYKNISVQISTLYGSILQTQHYKNTDFIQFPLVVPVGIYFVSVIRDARVFRQKIIIVRD